MNDIQKAERISRKRAIIFYLMATMLILSAILATGDGTDSGASRILPWLFMIFLIALNLTPVAGVLRRGNVRKLVNDDTTQDHRRTSFAAGFWAAIISAMSMTVVGSVMPIASAMSLRIVITAALAAALISFATQELRAAR